MTTLSGMRITVYMKPSCPYSRRAIQLLDERGLAFDQIDIAADPDERRQMELRAGKTSTPQIFIGEYHVGGYDDLVGLDSTGRLDQLLAGAAEPSALQP